MKIIFVGILLVKVLFCHSQIYDTIFDERDSNYYRTLLLDDMIWMVDDLEYSIKKEDTCPIVTYHIEEIEDVCPSGWRIAEEEDWRELIEILKIDDYENLFKYIYKRNILNFKFLFDDNICNSLTKLYYGNNFISYWACSTVGNKSIFYIDLKGNTVGVKSILPNCKLPVRCVKKMSPADQGLQSPDGTSLTK